MNSLISQTRCTLTIGLIFLASGCTTIPKPKQPDLTLPTPLRVPMKTQATASTPAAAIPPTSEEQPRTRFQPIPSAPQSKDTVATSLDEAKALPRITKTSPVSVNIEGLPIPAFINEVFGNLLGMSFEIDAKVQRERKLVTLRVAEPQPPKRLYELATQVLNNYGVGIEPQGDFLRFIRAKGQQTGTVPSMIVQGLTLPEVPPSHRPIFQFIPLRVTNYNEIHRWIRQIYKGHNIEIQADVSRNAIVLIGPPKIVAQAAKAIRILDQPSMRGRASLRIEPAFISADNLANNLIQILKTQGYSASTNPTQGNVVLLPIKETNAVIIFTADTEILAYVQQWAKQLDKLNPNLDTDEEQPGLFFYQVKNLPANNIAKVLNGLLGKITPIPKNKKKPSYKPLFMVDGNNNNLIFLGDNKNWARFLPILKSMDKPPKQVLIEATIAEITLTDQEQHGIEWVMANANIGGLDGRLGTLGGLGVGGSGLTYTLSSAAQVRAILNAFTNSNRATLLSTPRLMVRSGSKANINVGSEIPTLTSQTSTNIQQGGNSAVLQQVQYRRTGLTLNITPVVYAGRRVDLSISQQTSEARPNSTSSINSPEIQNRQISTKLILNDGQSVLLGGLISNSQSEGQSGVPFLSDIPLLGQLFRVDGNSSTRTELVIMIVPYVIDNAEEAAEITDAVHQQLELMPALNPQFSEPPLPLPNPPAPALHSPEPGP
jgi:general secretion pathway protein D